VIPWRILRCLLAVAVLAAPLGLAQAAASQGNSAAALPSRQILVMLKVPPQHFRPGAAYGGRYGDTAALASRRRTAENVAQKNGFTVVDGWPMPLLGVDCYVMRLPDGISIDAAVALASKDPRVAWSEPMQVYQAQGGGGARSADPLFPIEPAAVRWRLAELHKFATGRGVTVAIIDSKVEVTHPDLSGHFIADKNFLSPDPAGAEQHGTAVAGIIGASANNGIGIAGIAPGAELMALRACWQVTARAGTSAPTLCESLSIARALQYAIDHNANVINLSLSGPPGTLLSKLIAIALARNATVVTAFDPSLPKGGFPASLPGVVVVADQSLQNLPANVYGAPGRDIPTTQPGGKWYLVNGTSYSVAHVSGLVALVRERHSGARLSLAKSRMGAIDACATLLGPANSCDCNCRLSQVTAMGVR
jgi:subtilisin family serine protease